MTDGTKQYFEGLGDLEVALSKLKDAGQTDLVTAVQTIRDSALDLAIERGSDLIQARSRDALLSVARLQAPKLVKTSAKGNLMWVALASLDDEGNQHSLQVLSKDPRRMPSVH